MNIKSFEILCALKNHNFHYHETALTLEMTQSSVSKHIMNLENYFDCKIFDRSSGQVEFTKDGQIIYEMSKNIIYEIHRTKFKLHKKEVLKLGAGESLSHFFLMENIETRISQAINRPFWIKSADKHTLLNELLSDKIDCIISGEIISNNSIRKSKVCTLKYGIAHSINDEFFADKSFVNLRNLSNHTFLALDSNKKLKIFMENRPNIFKKVYISNSFKDFFELIASKNYVSIVLLTKHNHLPKNIKITPLNDYISLTIYMYTKKTLANSNSMEHLVSSALEQTFAFK